MSGPLATMMLGDQGADVVKVEPPDGDVLRSLGTQRNGMSAFFANLNRSKRSIGLDLYAERAAEVLAALVDRTDVVVHNFRPAAAARLGIDAAALTPGRPELIHVSIVGFGSDGPYGGRPAYDHVIQALAGFAAIQSVGSEPPALVRQGIIDKVTAYHVAQAVTAALFERIRTGQGRAIEVCMLDVAVATLWPDGMMNHTILAPDDTLTPISRSFRVTPTADGFIAFVTLTPRQQEQFLKAVGFGAVTRVTGELMRQAAGVIATKATAEVVDVLAAHDVPVAPVVGLDDLHEHEQVRSNQTVDEFLHPHLGPVRQANPALRFDDRRAGELRPAAELGEHNAEVLTELGFDEGAISDLVASGVLVAQPSRARPTSDHSPGFSTTAGRSEETSDL
jgi:crotonobetainyl-CoA:carnitine CoA-transferase CaiB-like acyl-CoA transferase